MFETALWSSTKLFQMSPFSVNCSHVETHTHIGLVFLIIFLQKTCKESLSVKSTSAKLLILSDNFTSKHIFIHSIRVCHALRVQYFFIWLNITVGTWHCLIDDEQHSNIFQAQFEREFIFNSLWAQDSKATEYEISSKIFRTDFKSVLKYFKYEIFQN